MEDLKIWQIASMAWTEIGLEKSEYPKLAEELIERDLDWKYVNKVIVIDVCGSFSIMSASMLLMIIPILGMLLVTPMPDWGYNEEYLKNKIFNWKKQSLLVNFFNPVRLIGYPLSLFMVWSLRRNLKIAFFRAVSNKQDT